MAYICTHVYNLPYMHTYIYIYKLLRFKNIPFLCICTYKIYAITYYPLCKFLNKFSTIYIFLPKFKKKWYSGFK